ncbi:MAG TPA: chemotaxis protein CheW [Gaiellaceae bacterium]|nr:chemotaxis protein CheW [Gaiellaceae bacterium]
MSTRSFGFGGGGAAVAEAPPGVDGAALSQYLSFFIGGEEYAVGILRVKEIIEYDVVTRVPSMPACVQGVLNLRGRVVPVIDLALTFGLPACTVTRRTCIVVVEREVEGDSVVMGILVDAVSQVLDLPASDVEPPPAFGTRARAELLDGMGKSGKKFVMLLNLDRALALDVAIVRDLVEGAAGGANGTDAVAAADNPVADEPQHAPAAVDSPSGR